MDNFFKSNLEYKLKVRNDQNYKKPKIMDEIVWTSVSRQYCNYMYMVIRLRAAPGGGFRGEKVM